MKTDTQAEALLFDELIQLGSNDNWNRYIERFSNLDVFYSQEYVSLFADVQKGTPEAVYYENENGKVFYPYIKRKIDIKEGYFDIITPYGYGGPILEGEKIVIKKFYEQFKEYCFNSNIITETVGLHPLLKNDEYINDIMVVDFIRKTTAVNLTLPLEEIRKNYSSNNKRNIRKAKKEGVKVFVSNNLDDIQTFIDLYYETMDRTNASSFYYFPQSFFQKQMNETHLSKPYLLFAKNNEQIIGGVLVIIGREFAHYHLGASKTEYLSLRPNNLLFDAMIEFSKSFGIKALHLGGGYEDNDSLYKFKTSFTNSSTFNYSLGKNIINHKVYEELTHIVNNDNVGSWSKFFPIYRTLS